MRGLQSQKNRPPRMESVIFLLRSMVRNTLNLTLTPHKNSERGISKVAIPYASERAGV